MPNSTDQVTTLSEGGVNLGASGNSRMAVVNQKYLISQHWVEISEKFQTQQEILMDAELSGPSDDTSGADHT
jgi:hypothetical protein